jgi:hypothetical protein
VIHYAHYWVSCRLRREKRDAKGQIKAREKTYVTCTARPCFLLPSAYSNRVKLHAVLYPTLTRIARGASQTAQTSGSLLALNTLSLALARTFSRVFRRSASSRRCIKRSPRRLVDKLAGDWSTFSDIVTVCSVKRQTESLRICTADSQLPSLIAAWITPPATSGTSP